MIGNWAKPTAKAFGSAIATGIKSFGKTLVQGPKNWKSLISASGKPARLEAVEIAKSRLVHGQKTWQKMITGNTDTIKSFVANVASKKQFHNSYGKHIGTKLKPFLNNPDLINEGTIETVRGGLSSIAKNNQGGGAEIAARHVNRLLDVDTLKNIAGGTRIVASAAAMGGTFNVAGDIINGRAPWRDRYNRLDIPYLPVV